MKSALMAFALAGLGLAALPATSRAEQLQRFDGYVVHYNAFTADQLAAEVAAAYKFQRSRRQGLVNITVQREKGAGEIEPVAATVTGTATNLVGQRTVLVMREIKEDGAIYYLGEFPVSGTDTLRFSIDVAPADSSKRHTLTFTQNFAD
ncbi:DUF4426 domain-containing protein [Tahibacter amnicola]|uniref:DUF4426 domain-containing protein n=1 Tax=Tahibacter amnicola TaxID=2976241 RepID=A0ABY6BHU8_9GAMM|nr:DUF4426 domain-containing protein [Tahibacter amnicola]UXI69347.1 DUF4426 domain-containing protein [Tahibacter amnicola]